MILVPTDYQITANMPEIASKTECTELMCSQVTHVVGPISDHVGPTKKCWLSQYLPNKVC